MLVVLRSRGEETQAAQHTMLQLQNTPVDNLWPAHSPLCEIIMSYYVINQTSALSLHCFDDGSSCSCTFESTPPSGHVWDVVPAMHLCLIMLDYYLIAWSMCRPQLIHKTVSELTLKEYARKIKGKVPTHMTHVQILQNIQDFLDLFIKMIPLVICCWF